jgi:hypothetical protein
LVAENIVWRKGKHRKTLQLRDENQLRVYLANQWQINDLDGYILALEREDSSRADFVKIATDSKISKERAFKGFLVNSYQPIEAMLNGVAMTIQPASGSFVFIYDFETFILPEDVTIVGMENAKNFKDIHKQQHLFKTIRPLFISRYPQNQSKDFIQWMQTIPNSYLHFGNFDIAGIGIYLNEYKKHLAEKASFFIPEDIENFIMENGNRERCDIQKINFKVEEIEEKAVRDLVSIIEKKKKGLNQEFFIK